MWLPKWLIGPDSASTGRIRKRAHDFETPIVVHERCDMKLLRYWYFIRLSMIAIAALRVARLPSG